MRIFSKYKVGDILIKKSKYKKEDNISWSKDNWKWTFTNDIILKIDKIFLLDRTYRVTFLEHPYNSANGRTNVKLKWSELKEFKLSLSSVLEHL